MTTAWALSWEGFETAVVALGKEVPHMIRGFGPDVLVLDFSQPEINGALIARLVREDWPDLPIVLACPREPIDTALPPNTECVTKPYSIDDLIEAIRRLIQRSSSNL
jgi:two-component system OmpR family response regulator